MYTREAHPDPSSAPCGSTEDLGWIHPSWDTSSLEERAQRVRWLKEDYGLNFPYLIDGLDNPVRQAYFMNGFYVGWVVDCTGEVLEFEPWAWATEDTQWCGLPTAFMNELDDFLDAYLDSPSVCYTGPKQTEQHRWVVPGAAHVTGLNNTQWSTDLTVSNPSSEIADVELELVLQNVAKSHEPSPNPDPVLARSLQIQPGETVEIVDLLPSLFGVIGSGTLNIEANQEVAIVARIVNRTATGAVGEIIPALPISRAVTDGRTGHLLMLEQSQRARSNLGLVTVGDVHAEVEVEVFDESGNGIGLRRFHVAPGKPLLMSRFLTRFSSQQSQVVRAEVRCVSDDCAVLPWATVVDQVTGDWRFVEPRLNGWTQDVVIAEAASKSDDAGRWQTDVFLHNEQRQSVVATIELRPSTGDDEDTLRDIFSVASGRSLLLADVVADRFGAEAEGTVMITGTTGFMATAHHYVDDGVGTMGATMSAVDLSSDQVIRMDRVGHLIQIEDTGIDGYNTDIRLTNGSFEPAPTQLQFFDAAGSEIGLLTRQVPARGFVHLENVLRKIGADGQRAVRVEIRTEGRITAAARYRNRRSGDLQLQQAWVELDR